MTTFGSRTARYFVTIKAAREIKGEMEKLIKEVGLDRLKALADAGQSIITIYFKGCSSEEKIKIRRDLNGLLQLGITADMILTEVARQMPELAPIMEGREIYKRSEVQKLEAFMKEE
ncbi:hypothetical protein ES703_121540 [subsurface metagenome]